MSRMGIDNHKRRANLDLDLLTGEKIDDLKLALNTTSMTEVVRRAVAHLHLVTVQHKNRVVVLHTPGHVPTVVGETFLAGVNHGS